MRNLLRGVAQRAKRSVLCMCHQLLGNCLPKMYAKSQQKDKEKAHNWPGPAILLYYLRVERAKLSANVPRIARHWRDAGCIGSGGKPHTHTLAKLDVYLIGSVRTPFLPFIERCRAAIMHRHPSNLLSSHG